MRMTLASFRARSRGRGISVCPFFNLPPSQCSASNTSLHLATPVACSKADLCARRIRNAWRRQI
jgi:hypothetical protein